jgi:arabinose-5-phosphate isomerase
MSAERPNSPSPAGTPSQADELAFARALLADEARAVSALADRLGAEFHRAVGLLDTCAASGGTVLVTGLGKSGLIGSKISATLASLGVASHSVHPAEAFHGDLGRFRANDTVIAISASGETDEVVNLAAILKQDGVPIIAITCGREGGVLSSLERLATAALTLGVREEAGHMPAPTSSTTATLALGDALALCVARRRNFTREDFARRHPGGSLGGLLRPVTEALRFVAGRNMPLIPDTVSVSEALARAAESGRRPGAITLVDARSGVLSGIFTDADLRRLILRSPAELTRPIAEVMTRSPRSLPDSALIQDAVRLVREFRSDEIPVVDGQGRPVGMLDVQDLIAMKLVQE